MTLPKRWPRSKRKAYRQVIREAQRRCYLNSFPSLRDLP